MDSRIEQTRARGFGRGKIAWRRVEEKLCGRRVVLDPVVSGQRLFEHLNCPADTQERFAQARFLHFEFVEPTLPRLEFLFQYLKPLLQLFSQNSFLPLSLVRAARVIDD
jgi:hypothetical protein